MRLNRITILLYKHADSGCMGNEIRKALGLSYARNQDQNYNSLAHEDFEQSKPPRTPTKQQTKSENGYIKHRRVVLNQKHPRTPVVKGGVSFATSIPQTPEKDPTHIPPPGDPNSPYYTARPGKAVPLTQAQLDNQEREYRKLASPRTQRVHAISAKRTPDVVENVRAREKQEREAKKAALKGALSKAGGGEQGSFLVAFT